MRSAVVSCFLLSFITSHCAGLSSPQTDEFLGPTECLNRNFTRESCDLVFCPPWQRCINGRCSCKPADQCPSQAAARVCGRHDKPLRSFCEAMAVSCHTRTPVMSHFGDTCLADQPMSTAFVEPGSGAVRLFVAGAGGSGGARGDLQELLVCQELWDTAAANVACRQTGYTLGAASIGSMSYAVLTTHHSDQQLPSKCVSVRCQGYENSLAECVIYDKTDANNGNVATATCAQSPGEQCEFRCVNSKCVSLGQTCDGVDDCGDRSDEMCCKKCRGGAFHCSSGVCLHREAVGDGQVDCLDGEDESNRHTRPATSLPAPTNTEFVSPIRETAASRRRLEAAAASCGTPQSAGVSDEDEEVRGRRSRRVVGGRATRPTQIQWQVAIYLNRNFHCGGALIASCWVVTAAHCVGSRAAALTVKLSMWSRTRPQASTDVVPVEAVHLHPRYDPSTRENDIALLQLQTLPFHDRCFEDNPAVSAVCVAWTTHLFHPNHTCTVSGWGQDAGQRPQVLQWAHVDLNEGCPGSNGRLKPGTICAGDRGGHVTTRQEDLGGPLVCEDQLGVSYLWGVVSQPGSPGVYTQVAHHFEWIRSHTGWPAVTKYNS